MEILTGRRDPGTPEGLVASLLNRLRHHVLWDLLLIYLPPLIVAIHCVTDLYRRAWLTESVFIALVLAGAVLALIVVMKRYRLALPSVPTAAHLIDERAGATDRFVTLSTVDPLCCVPSLLQRVRTEAMGFLRRVRLRQDFPYTLKRSFYFSLIGSLIFASLFHLLLPIVKSHYDTTAIPTRLREIAAKMEQRPQIAALGRALQKLAAQIEDPKLSAQEKQIALQQVQKDIEQEQKKEQTKESRDLLDQAAGTVKGAEQQSGGQQEQNKPDAGGGGIQSNLPQEGKGDAKSNAGSGGESKGDVAAQLSKGAQQGKTAQGEPKDQSGEKNQQKGGEGKGGDRPDLSQTDRNTGQDMSGKTQDDRENKLGKNKQPETIPQGAPPAERFNRPGEGKEGVKGARYVTVQLPEEVAADAKGDATGAKDSKGNRIGAKLPVSNVPLPARVPDAPSEKQQVPLEYRQIIR